MTDTKQRKVFCSECKHFYTDDSALCEIPRDTWLEKNQPSIPCIKNAGNDCPDFVPAPEKKSVFGPRDN